MSAAPARREGGGHWRLVLCDPHEAVRDGLRERLARLPSVRVVGEAVDGAELLALAGELEPDLVIAELALPGGDGLELVRELAGSRPATQTIVFSAHQDPELARVALRAGAVAYVLKSAPVDELVRAVEAALAGEPPPPPAPGAEESEVERLLELTPREREILDLFAEGLRAKQIAERLSLSPATVHTHARNAVARLGADSRTQAVALVVRYRYLAGAEGRYSSSEPSSSSAQELMQ